MAEAIEVVPLDSKNDLQKIIDLYIACFNAPDKNENWTQKTAAQYFQKRLNEGSIFYGVREKHGGLKAVLGGGPYENSFIAKDLEMKLEQCFYIFLIAVSPKMQGQGLGSFLTDQVLNIMHREGYQRVLARCRLKNKPVKKIFYNQGFEEVKRYTSSLGGVECERVILLKYPI